MNSIQNISRIVSKINAKEGHLYLEPGTTFEEAEKMCLEFIQVMGVARMQYEQQQAALKAQQDAQQAPESKVVNLPEGEQNV